jgi:hypothetical protein
MILFHGFQQPIKAISRQNVGLARCKIKFASVNIVDENERDGTYRKARRRRRGNYARDKYHSRVDGIREPCSKVFVQSLYIIYAYRRWVSAEVAISHENEHLQLEIREDSSAFHSRVYCDHAIAESVKRVMSTMLYADQSISTLVYPSKSLGAQKGLVDRIEG